MTLHWAAQHSIKGESINNQATAGGTGPRRNNTSRSISFRRAHLLLNMYNQSTLLSPPVPAPSPRYRHTVHEDAKGEHREARPPSSSCANLLSSRLSSPLLSSPLLCSSLRGRWPIAACSSFCSSSRPRADRQKPYTATAQNEEVLTRVYIGSFFLLILSFYWSYLPPTQSGPCTREAPAHNR